MTDQDRFREMLLRPSRRQIVSGMVSYSFAWYDEARPMSKDAISRQMLEQVLMSVGVDRARLEDVQRLHGA